MGVETGRPWKGEEGNCSETLAKLWNAKFREETVSKYKMEKLLRKASECQSLASTHAHECLYHQHSCAHANTRSRKNGWGCISVIEDFNNMWKAICSFTTTAKKKSNPISCLLLDELMHWHEVNIQIWFRDITDRSLCSLQSILNIYKTYIHFNFP